jgi:hypothetical protein
MNGAYIDTVARGLRMAQPRWGWWGSGTATQSSSQARNPGLEDEIPLGFSRNDYSKLRSSGPELSAL